MVPVWYALITLVGLIWLCLPPTTPPDHGVLV